MGSSVYSCKMKLVDGARHDKNDRAYCIKREMVAKSKSYRFVPGGGAELVPRRHPHFLSTTTCDRCCGCCWNLELGSEEQEQEPCFSSWKRAMGLHGTKIHISPWGYDIPSTNNELSLVKGPESISFKFYTKSRSTQSKLQRHVAEASDTVLLFSYCFQCH